MRSEPTPTFPWLTSLTCCQVPEDLQSILEDTSLFTKESDITTKEILRRYADRPSASAHTPVTNPEKPSLDSHDSKPNGTPNRSTPTPRAAAPIITHVDSRDPPHSNTWPKESSVSHIEATGATPVYPSTGNTMTSPKAQYEFVESQSPYLHQHQRAGSNDSQVSQAALASRQSYRHSGWGGKRSTQGSLGVTNAG